jgi:hypothetical protein
MYLALCISIGGQHLVARPMMLMIPMVLVGAAQWPPNALMAQGHP